MIKTTTPDILATGSVTERASCPDSILKVAEGPLSSATYSAPVVGRKGQLVARHYVCLVVAAERSGSLAVSDPGQGHPGPLAAPPMWRGDFAQRADFR